MRKESADALTEAIGQLVVICDDLAAKVKAAEIVIDRHPQISQEYENALAQTRKGATLSPRHQFLDSLRSILLQDQ